MPIKLLLPTWKHFFSEQTPYNNNIVRSPKNVQAWETCQRCQTTVKKRDFTFGHCQEQYGRTSVEICEDSKSSPANPSRAAALC